MGFNPEYAPLTNEERDTMNRVSTPRSEATRLYARDLMATADAYLKAADAPGMRKDASKYLASEAARLHREARLHLDRADNLELDESLAARVRHTVRGETSEVGWPYGTTHDMDCPACVASGSSFSASPRSETYWSS